MRTRVNCSPGLTGRTPCDSKPRDNDRVNCIASVLRFHLHKYSSVLAFLYGHESHDARFTRERGRPLTIYSVRSLLFFPGIPYCVITLATDTLCRILRLGEVF